MGRKQKPYDALMFARYDLRGRIVMNMSDLGRELPTDTHPDKTGDVHTVDYDKIDDLLAQALREQRDEDARAEARRRVQILHSFGRDTADRFPHGTVIRFSKTYPAGMTVATSVPQRDAQGRPVYAYAALKVVEPGLDAWYVTGPSRLWGGGHAVRWADLLAALLSGPYPTDTIEVMRPDEVIIGKADEVEAVTPPKADD